jgi:hypothetical protein
LENAKTAKEVYALFSAVKGTILIQPTPSGTAGIGAKARVIVLFKRLVDIFM